MLSYKRKMEGADTYQGRGAYTHRGKLKHGHWHGLSHRQRDGRHGTVAGMLK